MVHIKKLNDFINESQTRVKVNGSTNGRNEYEVKIAQEFTGAEYLFTVYANDEAQAIDLVLDLVSKRYKELVANVPSDFSNDWGYDDEGGYTAYGDDSPYVFNSEGTIAVNADGFEITERRGGMSESRASRKGFKQLNESSFSDAFSGKGTKDIEVRIREMMLLFEGYVSGYGNKIVVDGLNNEFIENKFQCDDYDIVTMSDTSEVWVLFNHNHLIPEEKMFHELDKETQRIVYDDFIDYMNRNFLDNMRLKYNQL